MIHILIERYKRYVDGEITYAELVTGQSELLEFFERSSIKGERKIKSSIQDVEFFYLAMTASIGALTYAKNLTDAQMKILKDVTPLIVNLIVGMSDELGLNPNAFYSIDLKGDDDERRTHKSSKRDTK